MKHEIKKKYVRPELKVDLIQMEGSLMMNSAIISTADDHVSVENWQNDSSNSADDIWFTN